MSEEMIMMEENTEVLEVCNEAVKSSGGILGKLVLGTVIIGTGAAALLYKNRAKLEERRIKKLEKKGYVIYKPEDVKSDISEDYEDAR